MEYWLIVTSPENFKHSRDNIGFNIQGLPYRFRKQVKSMKIGDKVVTYIMKVQKFGAITKISGDYFEDYSKVWLNDEEMWPARRAQESEIILNDDELIDAKRLINDLTFVENKEFWGSHFQGSIKRIPEVDFKLIESEMRKIVNERIVLGTPNDIHVPPEKTEAEYEEAIMQLPSLESKSLHDRLGEMLEIIGGWMDYNTQTRHKIIPEHAYEIDVAWLDGRNPEVAIEIQISGNLTEAKDRLAQARKFNYRKVVMILKSSDLNRLNNLMKHEPELRSWMEAWSIGSIYQMFMAGEAFFKYFRKLKEAVYKDKKTLELIE